MRSRIPAVVGLLWVGGCGGCPPLAEVSAEGEPRSLQVEAENALRDFDGWVDADLCVSKVRIGRVGRDRGRYNPVTHGVTVDPDQGAIRTGVLHELCHAADTQLGAIDGREADFAAEAADERPNAKRQAREGFAEVCSVGAPGIRFATERVCPGDALGPAWALVRDRLYDQPVEELAIALIEEGRWTPEGWPADLDLRACTADEEGIGVRFVDAAGEEYTANRRWSDGAWGPRVYSVFDFVEIQAHATPEGWASNEYLATEPGHLVWASFDPTGETIQARRLFFQQAGGGFGLIPICPDRQADCAFGYDGAAWLGHWDGEAFAWSRVVGSGRKL